ncbi:SWIM-type domain-containing protein [Trichonephila clavata]|uniref:SWIM-type domain-containing protein n=1 Tax=Trichonephila clavata TaxID=2740835 RepID=A0A8X6JCR1_TRICU|nr:SWIM-type domain-containing protein [Trichonephila clavata]
MDLPLQLQELLPCGYSYKLKKWTPFENKPNHFEAILLTNVYTEEEAQEWWHEFNVKSNTTMRVRATCPKTGKVNTFKIYLRCLHQGRAEKSEKSDCRQKTKSTAIPVKRNTNCPAGMIVAIRRHIKYSRSKMRDPVDPVHPCEIQIRYVHNHPTNSADSLRFRPVSKEAEEKLINLYQIGHSPASALEMLKIDLQIEHGSSYSKILSDRYHCPDKSFCYRLYYKHFGKDYAASSKKDVINLLNTKILDYNSDMGELCVCIGLSGTDYAIAVCTPLMKRAHSLVESGSVVYIEASESPGNKERAEHYVLLMVAHTAAGGVPLGAVLCTSNSAAVLTLGFQLLKQLLPEHAFYCRSESGPYACMIEDSESQLAALRSVWPESDIIICIFRVLQHMWRWLWDEKHNILKDHRLYLLYLTKTLLFASNETEIDEKYQALCGDSINVVPSHIDQEIKQVAGNYFLVPCENGDEKIHTVDLELNTCSCPLGTSGALCIHQYWVFLKVPSEMFKTGFMDFELKQKLYIVATGNDSFAETLQFQSPVVIPHSTIPGVISVESSTIRTECAPLTNVECIFTETNSSHSIGSSSSTSNVLLSQSNPELVTLSSVGIQVSSNTFINALPHMESINNSITTNSGIIDNKTSNVEIENVSTPTQNASKSAEEPERDQNESEMEKRMTKVLEKFEDFCQRVRDGLKNQPKSFLPALEIMMKTLERKGNSNDLLISGLSFFGVLSAPSLVNKSRKRNTISSAIHGGNHS